MNNGDENHTELLTVHEITRLLNDAGFLGVRALFSARVNVAQFQHRGIWYTLSP